MKRQLVVVSLLALTACSEPPAEGSYADLVVINADVYTADANRSRAAAFAVKDDRFIYVGTNEEAEALANDDTRVVDLGGRGVIPGIVDSHTHPGLMDLEEYHYLPDDSEEAFFAAIKQHADDNPGDDWLRFCCWPNRWYVDGTDGPDKADLDAIIPDRPVWITSEAWHSYWVNSKGLDVLGVDDDSQDPRPGIAVYYRDEDGELTGWIKEGAGWQHLYEQFPPSDPEWQASRTRAMLERLAEFGVTTVYDGGNFEFADHVYSNLAKLEQAGELPVRYEGTFPIYIPKLRNVAVAEMKRYREMYGGERLQFNTIKMFMDGVNENRSAGMLEPYSDNPDYVGNTMMTVEELTDFLIELHHEKFDLHIHSISDLATRTALDGVEAAQKLVGDAFYPRVSLSHLELVDPDDWPRFAELGVAANFTPWWHGYDFDTTVPEAFGEDRINRTYIARPLFESGARVTYSSDTWDMEVLSPYLGMEVGHNRQYPIPMIEAFGGDINAMRLPESERLDLEMMIDGYTIHGAWAQRMENDIGSIEAGKLADFIVLERSLFDMGRRDIHTVEPVAVVVEGTTTHGALP